MARFSIILSSLILSSFLVSCSKDNNQMSGVITFKKNAETEQKLASLASVSLYQNKDTHELASYSTKTNDAGQYLFPRIMKGTYFFKINFQEGNQLYDTILPISFEKNEKKEMNILLISK